MSDNLEQIRVLEKLKAGVTALEKSDEANVMQIRKLVSELGELRGRVDSLLPQHQENIRRIFELLDDREETAKIYYGESRTTAHTVEMLKAVVEDKATKESVKNTYLWVTAGFVAVSVTVLLWVIAVFFKLFELGVPTP